ncbi:hypothetical protein DPMN_136840 [Dreissena polymorpha]|uniref:Uncharacterized protein n=1 Tax=Dreissena polymorpha TaxID=45954 RepID=A0A9D4G3L3_DREPO|nr:hypothetical protein DPMN_136840 [Dreissena polymorpha]
MDTDIRGERWSRSGEEDDPSQHPRNKYRRHPFTPPSQDHTGLSGMLGGDSFLDSLLETQSPHSEIRKLIMFFLFCCRSQDK